mmetsp:Transcript_46740/g.91260  ORF Transcript_46740/g.91260 Transcript_46740/m.91260 type:complete len:80 (-) Transcript_46740:93-332(-)
MPSMVPVTAPSYHSLATTKKNGNFKFSVEASQSSRTYEPINFLSKVPTIFPPIIISNSVKNSNKKSINLSICITSCISK